MIDILSDSTRLILAYSSIGIFLSYLAYTFAKFGISRSISKTWYLLKPKNKWLFRAATWGYAVTLGLAGGTWLTYAAGALVSLVGFTPDTKGKDNELEEKIHIIGATGGIVAAMAALVHMSDFALWYLPVIQIAFSIPAMKAPLKDHTWYIEVLAYAITVGGIISQII